MIAVGVLCTFASSQPATRLRIKANASEDKMPRRRVTRPECDCSDCRYVFPSDSLLGTSVSRQQPPPKCLIVCAPACLKTDGGSTSEASTELQYPHIVAAVRSGSSGLLALRTGERTIEQQSHTELTFSSSLPFLLQSACYCLLAAFTVFFLTYRWRASRDLDPVGAEQSPLRFRGI